MIEDDRARGTAEKRPSQLGRRMSPDLRNLPVSDILIRFAEQIPYAFVAPEDQKAGMFSVITLGNHG